MGAQKSEKSVAVAPSTIEKRGTRLPEDWMPRSETVAQIKAEFAWITSADLSAEHRSFTDWARGSSTRNAVKKDWDATWRNWMRREFRKPNYRQREGVGDKPRGWMEVDAHA